MRRLLILPLLALAACSAESTTGIDLDLLDEYEQAMPVTWDAMTQQQRAEACAPLAAMSRDDYQRIIQISFEGERQFEDPGLAAYAWAEWLEVNC